MSTAVLDRMADWMEKNQQKPILLTQLPVRKIDLPEGVKLRPGDLFEVDGVRYCFGGWASPEAVTMAESGVAAVVGEFTEFRRHFGRRWPEEYPL